MSLKELLALQLEIVTKPIKRLVLRKIEEHYTISAEAEDRKALEAQANASHFYTKAALIRSKRAALR